MMPVDQVPRCLKSVTSKIFITALYWSAFYRRFVIAAFVSKSSVDSQIRRHEQYASPQNHLSTKTHCFESKNPFVANAFDTESFGVSSANRHNMSMKDNIHFSLKSHLSTLSPTSGDNSKESLESHETTKSTDSATEKSDWANEITDFLLDKDIKKPLSYKDRQHKFFKFRNGLRVMIIHDPKVNYSAAAMNVDVGTIFDEKNVQGEAHFLEHMLFLGTEKYPDEKEYSKYLQEHGGSANAFTSEDRTCYYFYVEPHALDGALDRFSQFFISPLFTKSATEREINAVNSEFLDLLEDDGARASQILRNMANPDHPVNHFQYGNLETMTKSIGKDNLRPKLLQFYDKYYSANIMQLAVIGRESIDELEKMLFKFLNIKNKNVKIPKGQRIGGSIVPFRPEDLGKQVFVYPIRDLKTLFFSFAMEEQQYLWKAKPLVYLTYFLTHEGTNSLAHVLKSKGLAVGVAAGISDLDIAGVSFYDITVNMTDLGATDDGIKEIGKLLFAYVNLLRYSPTQRWMHDESAKMANIYFTYSSKDFSVQHCLASAFGLSRYSPNFAISGSRLIYEFDPNAIRRNLENMKWENMILMIRNKKYESICESKDPIFGTKYKIDSLDDSLLQAWTSQEASVNDADKSNHIVQYAKSLGLDFPKPNPFIPEDFNLRFDPKNRSRPSKPKSMEDYALEDYFLPPPQIIDDHLLRKAMPDVNPEVLKNIKVHFRQDDFFKLPKSIIYLKITNPSLFSSALEYEMVSLYLTCMDEALMETTYEASQAGLSYDMSMSGCANYIGSYDGLEIYVNGFSDKLIHYLNTILSHLVTPSLVTPEIFEREYQNYVRNLKNTRKRTPDQLITGAKCETLCPNFYGFEQRLAALKNLKYNDMIEYIRHGKSERSSNDKTLDDGKTIFGSGFFDFLIQGNYNESEAVRAVTESVKTLNMIPLGKMDKSKWTEKSRCLKLEALNKPTNLLRVKKDLLNPEEPNNGCMISLQLGQPTIEEAAMAGVASNWLGRKFFDDLRTKKQFGYVVYASLAIAISTHQLDFVVQSTRSSAAISTEIHKFINNHLNANTNVRTSDNVSAKSKPNEMEKKGNEIEKKGNEMEKKGTEMEKKGNEIGKKGNEIENKGNEIEKKGDNEEPFELSQEEFDLHRKAVLTNVKEIPDSLIDESSGNYLEICNRRLEFDRLFKIAQFLDRKLTLRLFKEFLQSLKTKPWLLIELNSKVPQSAEQRSLEAATQFTESLWSDLTESDVKQLVAQKSYFVVPSP